MNHPVGQGGPTSRPNSGPDIEFMRVDEDLLVVEKPAGMLCVPGRGPLAFDALSLRVQRSYPDALIVHRLDMATSGLVLMARSKTIQRALSAAFEQRRVDKLYVAVVAGLIEADAGVIDLPLAADWEHRPVQAVDHVRGKRSITHFRVLDRDEIAYTTRLELRSLTGRTHQLRVHLLALGHPIVGDALYAPATSPTKAPAMAMRLMLHASRLALAHPRDASRIEVASTVPF